MKKILLLSAAVTLSLGSFAQIIWQENFESTTGTAIPGTFTQTTLATDGGWKSGTGATLSSTDCPIPDHTRFIATNDDACNCDKSADIVVTPSVNLTSYTSNVYLQFDCMFPGGTYQGFTEKAYISYSTNGGTTWTQLDTMVASLDFNWYQRTYALTAVLGQSDVKIAIKYYDGTGWLFGMAVDNMKIFVPSAYDMSVTSVTVPNFKAVGTVPVTGVIKNMGINTITSFTLNYTINGGSAVSAPITGVNIPTFGTYTFTHPTNWNAATPGAYTVEAYATNLNGSNVDANTGDDKKSKVVNILSENVQRIPLFEVFTSSTCPPCNPGNANYHSIVDTKPAADFVTVKYQQDFPGTGDPYCTTEAVNRRNTPYAINSIPRMEIDGGWDGNAQSFTNTMYDEARLALAQYKMQGTFNVNNMTVSAKVKFSPLFNATGAKLYVAVLERETINNIKSNGETKFLQVMKKMLPNENGTALPTVAIGSWDSLSFNYVFKGNYRLPTDGQTANIINHTIEHSVENFYNTDVVAWIQAADKTVYQAVNLTSLTPTSTADFSASISTIEVYPNPATDLINISMNLKINDEIMATMIDLKGNVIESKSVKMQAGKNAIQFNTSRLAAGTYHVLLFDSKNNSSVHQVEVAH
ncbi:hypothetical protein EMGBS15_18980 [Filimonas sp.]|nr:hypothetical protein EMGBS15_18980 [Filimonas sp.]